MRIKSPLFVSFLISYCDGLVLPIVALSALSQITQNNKILLAVGGLFVILFSIVMGLGHYYTGKNHADNSVKAETFQNIGLSEDLEKQLLKDHEQEKQEWDEILAVNEFTSSIHNSTSWATVAAYLTSGLGLLLPFIFYPLSQAIICSYVLCGLLILVSGAIKAKLTGNHPMRVIGKNLLNAAVLCGLVYLVTAIFS